MEVSLIVIIKEVSSWLSLIIKLFHHFSPNLPNSEVITEGPPTKKKGGTKLDFRKFKVFLTEPQLFREKPLFVAFVNEWHEPSVDPYFFLKECSLFLLPMVCELCGGALVCPICVPTPRARGRPCSNTTDRRTSRSRKVASTPSPLPSPGSVLDTTFHRSTERVWVFNLLKVYLFVFHNTRCNSEQ
jgi:hypothetical protein